MNKIFTLFFSFLLGTTAMMAQTGIMFVDAAEGGNEVPDGSEITVSDYENGQISSGLYVTNTSMVGQNFTIEYDIKTLPNGSSQICFPIACTQQTSVGTYETVKEGSSLRAGETRDFQAEWKPTAYGTSTVTYTVKYYNVSGNYPIYDYEFDSYGPSVTVNYVYKDPASVNSIDSDDMVRSVEYFDMAGQRVSNPQNGLYLQRMVTTTGKTTTNKVIIK